MAALGVRSEHAPETSPCAVHWRCRRSTAPRMAGFEAHTGQLHQAVLTVSAGRHEHADTKGVLYGAHTAPFIIFHPLPAPRSAPRPRYIPKNIMQLFGLVLAALIVSRGDAAAVGPQGKSDVASPFPATLNIAPIVTTSSASTPAIVTTSSASTPVVVTTSSASTPRADIVTTSSASTPVVVTTSSASTPALFTTSSGSTPAVVTTSSTTTPVSRTSSSASTPAVSTTVSG